MKNKKRKALLFVTCGLIAALAVGFTIAYLTDNEMHINKATPGDIVTEIVEEFEPPNPEDIQPGNTIQYKKKIQAKNTGKSDAYIRMAVAISDGDIANESEYSLDGTTWYPVSEYKDHLPEGWIYLDDDSLGGAYFYYTRPVKAEKRDIDGNITQEAEMTPPLFQYVRTKYSDEREAYPYDIYAYAEAMQLVDASGKVQKNENTITKPADYAVVKTWRSYYEGRNG